MNEKSKQTETESSEPITEASANAAETTPATGEGTTPTQGSDPGDETPEVLAE